MSARRSARPWVGIAVGLAVTLGLACDHEADEDTEEFRADVLWCEDAAARLAECCPGIAPIPCYHFRGGCEPNHRADLDPALSRQETSCIRDLDCNALRERGVCDRASKRAAAQTALVTQTPAPDAGFSPLVVCP